MKKLFFLLVLFPIVAYSDVWNKEESTYINSKYHIMWLLPKYLEWEQQEVDDAIFKVNCGYEISVVIRVVPGNGLLKPNTVWNMKEYLRKRIEDEMKKYSRRNPYTVKISPVSAKNIMFRGLKTVRTYFQMSISLDDENIVNTHATQYIFPYKGNVLYLVLMINGDEVDCNLIFDELLKGVTLL